jgi:hypothetical protein
MLTLLSTVSGYFSRSLILGAFLPTIIFVALFVLLGYPLFPPKFSLFLRLSLLETEWKLLSLTFVTTVFSGLLYNLNNPLIRLYEGYPWKKTWFGEWLTKRKRKEFCRLRAYERGVRTLLITIEDADARLKQETIARINQWLANSPRSLKNTLGKSIESKCEKENNWQALYAVINGRWQQLSRQLINEFPEKEILILPTALGNIIRSFEYYPEREYKIDAVTLYPRLVAKIDKEYAIIIDDAKTSFDFMVNSSFLSAIIVFLLVISGIIFGKPFITTTSILVWLIEIGFFLCLTISFYKGAIKHAFIWGETVKSAFDLYRNPLLEQLGFTQVLTTKPEERELWNEISLQMIDGDPTIGPPRLTYRETSQPATQASGSPEDVKLTVLKSATYVGDNLYRVIITVSNDDKSKKQVKKIVLIDTVPSGWFYRHGSAKLFEEGGPDASVEISGINPYRFPVGTLAYNKKKTVSYEILFLKKGEEEK